MVEIFGDGFDDPVAIGKLCRGRLRSCRGDERGGVVDEESAGALFGGVVDSFERGGVAVGLVGRTISRRTEGMPAFAKWAAILAPMVPAPRTATF